MGLKQTAIVNVVGLTASLLGESTPHLNQFLATGAAANIDGVLPAVTCTAQSTYLTGKMPTEHGIVGNGWFFREECEVKFWRQSNKLVQSPKLWEVIRETHPTFTTANLFWWYNMYSSVEYAITPRPMYPADGRKYPDIYTSPMSTRATIQNELGPFPLFHFWGPNTSIHSSQWIADSAIWTHQHQNPDLTLIYLPHLDYNLQRLGPNHPRISQDLQEIDAVCGQLIDYFQSQDVQLVFLSEYGIVDVDQPVHLNRIFRKNGLLSIREELGLELLDPGTCKAFAVADHQIAHVYLNDKACRPKVRQILEATPGVGEILDDTGKATHGLDHPRAGDFVILAKPNAWFSYYYWLDDSKAPDFARTVDIHRKPGYDPVELFVDPKLNFPRLRVAYRLAQKVLGFRYLMDVIPLNAELVKGSHGLLPSTPSEGPLFITQRTDLLPSKNLQPTQVASLLRRHIEQQ